MATLLGNQKLKRTVRVYGIDEPVVVTFTADGLTMQVKGSRQSVSNPWRNIVLASLTPNNCRCYHAGRPLELLKSEAKKVADRREKKNATIQKQ